MRHLIPESEHVTKTTDLFEEYKAFVSTMVDEFQQSKVTNGRFSMEMKQYHLNTNPLNLSKDTKIRYSFKPRGYYVRVPRMGRANVGTLTGQSHPIYSPSRSNRRRMLQSEEDDIAEHQPAEENKLTKLYAHSHDIGIGVCAAENFQKNTRICEYKVQIISTEVAAEREQEYAAEGLLPTKLWCVTKSGTHCVYGNRKSDNERFSHGENMELC